MAKNLLIGLATLLSIATYSQKFQKAVIELSDGNKKSGLVNGKSLSDSKEIKFKNDDNAKAEAISKNTIKAIDFYSSNNKIYHIENISIANEKKTKFSSEWMLNILSGYYELYVIADYSFDKEGNLKLSTNYIAGKDLPEFYYYIKNKDEKYAEVFAAYSPSPTYFGLHKILKENVIKFMSDNKPLVEKVESKKLSTKNVVQIVREYNDFKK
ncbi:hypothetical protein [Chryseobacterium sp. T1]